MLWIRILINFSRLDLDSGGQNDPKNLKKFIFFRAGCSLFKAEGFSCSLDFLHIDLGINKRAILDDKKLNFVPAVKMFNFRSSKPWIRIRNWIRIRMALKCWIRTRMALKCWIRTRIKPMLIHNTVKNSCFDPADPRIRSTYKLFGSTTPVKIVTYL